MPRTFRTFDQVCRRRTGGPEGVSGMSHHTAGCCRQSGDGVEEDDRLQGGRAFGRVGDRRIGSDSEAEQNDAAAGEQCRDQTAATVQEAESPALSELSPPLPGRADQGAPEKEHARHPPERIQDRHAQDPGQGHEIETARGRDHERNAHQLTGREAVGENPSREIAEHRGDAVGREDVTQVGIGKVEDFEHGRSEEAKDVKRQAVHHLPGEHQGEHGENARARFRSRWDFALHRHPAGARLRGIT